MTGQISVQVVGNADVLQIAEDILIKMHFTIDKSDAASGYLRTRPLPGAQFFEFWRNDNIGSDNSLFANLHSIRRSVEINIASQNEEINIGCLVRVQRLSLPERQISSNSRAYEMFSRSSPLLQRLQLNPEQAAGMTWIDLDRDRQLEMDILRQIEEQIVLETGDQLPPAGKKI